MEHAHEVDMLGAFIALWRGKWIVASVTIVAMMIAALLSFVVLSPVYEAKATIMVVALTKRPEKGSEEEPLSVSTLQEYIPEMSLEAYRQQVVNPVVLARVKMKLGLKDSVERLTRAVTARSLKDTNLIEVVTRYSDADVAAAISNAVAEEYERYLSEVNRQQMKMASTLAEQQLRAEEKKLGEAVDEYKRFLKEMRPVAEIKEEIRAKTDLLTFYRSELIRIEVEVESKDAFIGQCEAELDKQPQVLTTTKSILDDSLMQEVAGEKAGASLGSLAGLRIKSEETNTVHLALASSLASKRSELAEVAARRQAVSRAVGDLERNLEVLRLECAEKEMEEQRLTTKVETLRNVYLAFLKEYEKAKIGEALELGQASVSVSVRADKPEKPVAPKGVFNMAVAGVLGAMVSTFAVLTMSSLLSTRDKRSPVPPGARPTAA